MPLFPYVFRDEKFVLKLTYLVEICSKLNDLNLYLQGMDAGDIFSVHDNIRGLMKKLYLRKKMLKAEIITLATFIVESEATLDEESMIVAHLDSLKESFDYYFSE
ncbi:Zinc finger BED domain-containing protein 5 [Trichinella sp. T8]|nr:Zinc finger BED domain-containing protein 5 [Trichinella sp. T8]